MTKEKEKLRELYKITQLSLTALKNIEQKGFKTLNQAWLSVVKNQITTKKLDKFAKLFGEGVTIKKEAWSWDFYKKYKVKSRFAHLHFNEDKIGSITINESNKIERHSIGNSLNLREHTVASLIQKNEKYIGLFKKLEQRLKSCLLLSI